MSKVKQVLLLDTPAAHFDAGFCNGLMMLGSWIRDNERPSAQTKRILEMITALVGEQKHEN